jgi:hypothetical protein
MPTARAYALGQAPLDFVTRLVSLIPPPHFNMVRYHGLLAARAHVRSEVVPGPAPAQREPIQLRLAFDGEATPSETAPAPASRHPWAWLLQRVFAVDAMTCSHCGGRMRLLELGRGTGDDFAAGRGMSREHAVVAQQVEARRRDQGAVASRERRLVVGELVGGVVELVE